MKRTPKVVAWGVADSDDTVLAVGVARTDAAGSWAGILSNTRLVPLVRTDPDKERVVRAAVRWARAIQELDDYSGPVDEPLMEAVEKLQKGRRK